MSLKTYQARSMSEALARVKEDLGRDAVILHTRTFKSGGWLGWGGRRVVEITAAHAAKVAPAATRRPSRPALPASQTTQRSVAEPAVAATQPVPERVVPPAPMSAPRAADVGFERDLRALRGQMDALLRETRAARLPALPNELVEAWTGLISGQVAEELARELLAGLCQPPGDPAAIRATLTERIAAMVPTAGPIEYGTDGRPRVVALVGPTGVGKTTTIAKLAANAKLRDGRRVGLITVDHFRIAAIEQLRTYAGIMEIPLVAVSSADEMAAARERLADRDLVLIDTAGRSPHDEPRLAELRSLLESAKPDETHLVVSSSQGEAALLRAVERFAPLGVNRLLVTKLDEAVGFGVVLNVLRKVDLRLSYVTNGQAVPNDIDVARPADIAARLLADAPTRTEALA